jgi:O-antigen/teichoic acid export membrane protein
MHTSAVMLLGYFYDLSMVAFFRVALPLALFNRLVMSSFATLYKPSAARLFARNDFEGINKLYWSSAVWIAALSFPIFATTFSLAKPLTLYLYGPEYAPSAVILTLLSFGYYFDAALGHNGLTLKVLGKIRYVVTINVVVCITSVGLHLLLIPRFGTLGAAISTTTAVILYNILKQTGLRLVTGISLFDRQYAPFYLTLFVAASGLLVVGFFTPPNIFVATASAGLVSLLVLSLTRKRLKVAETFPELARLPLMRVIFA